jgi:hypothetical protein
MTQAPPIAEQSSISPYLVVIEAARGVPGFAQAPQAVSGTVGAVFGEMSPERRVERLVDGVDRPRVFAAASERIDDDREAGAATEI